MTCMGTLHPPVLSDTAQAQGVPWITLPLPAFSIFCVRCASPVQLALLCCVLCVLCERGTSHIHTTAANHVLCTHALLVSAPTSVVVLEGSVPVSNWFGRSHNGTKRAKGAGRQTTRTRPNNKRVRFCRSKRERERRGNERHAATDRHTIHTHRIR